MKELSDELDKVNAKINDANVTLENQNQRCNDLEQQNAEFMVEKTYLEASIFALRAQEYELMSQIQSDKNNASAMDYETNDGGNEFSSERMKLMFDELHKSLNNQFTIMSQEIESRIKLEFNKVQNKIVVQDENSAKRKKTLGKSSTYRTSCKILLWVIMLTFQISSHQVSLI